jgi:ribonucleoside-diphosphate reductase alpha chain
VISFARQGYKNIDFAPTTPIGQRGLTSVGQNSTGAGHRHNFSSRAGRRLAAQQRGNGKIAKTVKARIVGKVSYAAWACADPGIQFHTSTMTQPPGGR